MDEKILPWILVGIGVVILAAVFLLEVVPDKVDRSPAQAAIQPVEPLEQEEEIPSSEAAVKETEAGLSEAQRKAIYYEATELEYKAILESEARYPLPKPSDPGYTQETFLEQSDRQLDVLDKLLKQYFESLADRNGLTFQQVRDIHAEGLVKGWPKPAFPG